MTSYNVLHFFEAALTNAVPPNTIISLELSEACGTFLEYSAAFLRENRGTQKVKAYNPITSACFLGSISAYEATYAFLAIDSNRSPEITKETIDPQIMQRIKLARDFINGEVSYEKYWELFQHSIQHSNNSSAHRLIPEINTPETKIIMKTLAQYAPSVIRAAKKKQNTYAEIQAATEKQTALAEAVISLYHPGPITPPIHPSVGNVQLN